MWNKGGREGQREGGRGGRKEGRKKIEDDANSSIALNSLMLWKRTHILRVLCSALTQPDKLSCLGNSVGRASA